MLQQPKTTSPHCQTSKNTRQIEMKIGFLQILNTNPFVGLDHEDTYTHVTKFYELSSTLGAPEEGEKAMIIRLFPHSLIRKPKEWYSDQPIMVITNWNTLEDQFLNMFSPHKKNYGRQDHHHCIFQGSTETLCEVWERYKPMMRRCPNHVFDNITHIHITRNELQHQPKLQVDANVGGSLVSKNLTL